jgi:hypothetical protein
MSLVLAALLALAPSVDAVDPPGPVQDAQLYRVLNVRAAPGRLLDLIELHRDRMALLESLGEEPGFWMRHSQGDHWDLMFIQPIGSMGAFFDPARARRLREATSPGGRTGGELALAIGEATSWREELFAAGAGVEVVRERFEGARLFHVEMFVALAGKRAELLREREMENAYLAELGRGENLIFVRVAGAAWDSFTLGFYRDLHHYAEAGSRPAEAQQAAALSAGFEGADHIGAYLRELIASHHDTLAVPLG